VLRRQTLQWLIADWPGHPAIQDSEQTLDELRSMRPIAIALMHDAAGRIRIQSKSLGEAEAEVKALRQDVDKLETSLRAERENLAEVKQQLTASQQAAQEAEKKRHTLDLAFKAETAHLKEQVREARAVIAMKDRDLSVLTSKARRDRRDAIHAAEEAAKVREALIERVNMLERSESFRIGYTIV